MTTAACRFNNFFLSYITRQVAREEISERFKIAALIAAALQIADVMHAWNSQSEGPEIVWIEREWP